LLRVLPLNRLDRVPAPGRCESGQVEVVVRPSQGVLRLRLGDRRLPVNEELLGVTYARLMRSPEFRGAWWKAGLPELPPGAELLYLMQLNDPHAGMVVPAFSLVPLDLSGGGTASVCFVKDAQPRVRLGDWDLDQIVAVRR
jgi:hypothetical protein